MIFLDINTFFSGKAGGIRTYHQAKIEWFMRHPEHAYILVHPGPAARDRQAAPHVRLSEAFGPALTRDPAGYRLLIDFLRVYRLIRRARPDVLEAGDPWLTGLFCLLLAKLGLYRGLLISFYHSDPVPSYFEPWAARGRLRPLKAMLARLGGNLFYRLQRGYPLTAVSSGVMAERLRSRGVGSIACLPFGVPDLFIGTDPPVRGPGAGVRILYAGRLDRDKGIDLILEALAAILDRREVRFTVAGRGGRADRFAAFVHERYRYLGFVEDPAGMRALYDEHDILLAPGPYETFGLGVLEAMARGMVVVGPDQGGTGELLAQMESPFVFPAGDGTGFLAALDRALACDLAHESARSRALALRYGSWNDSVGRMVERYASLARGRSP